MGSENWGISSDLDFGVGRAEERGIWVFEEAMIMLAMAVVMAPAGDSKILFSVLIERMTE